MKSRKLNLWWLRVNVGEAAEELLHILTRVTEDESDENLAVRFEHAYHHLNNAWNGRHTSDKARAQLSSRAPWARFPSDLKPHRVGAPRSRPKKKSSRSAR